MIIGIDYSISCPSACVLDPTGSFRGSKIHFLTTVKKRIKHESPNISCELHKPWKDQEERFDHISNSVIQFIESQHQFRSDPITVYLEDYAMGAKGRVFHIGESTGLLKHKLHNNPLVTLHTVEPTVLKKFATGKGNAKKEHMYAALLAIEPELHTYVKWWWTGSEEIDSPISDIVDSYWLARYGASQEPQVIPDWEWRGTTK